LTPARLWARLVNSRFSMVKHSHVFGAAEACKLFWLILKFSFLFICVWGGLVQPVLIVRRYCKVSESAVDEGSVAEPLLT